MNLRQTIIIRTDLQFPTGLLCAQVAHLHMDRLRIELNAGEFHPSEREFRFKIGPHEGAEKVHEWLQSPYVFVHGVPNLEVLNHFHAKAINNGVQTHQWRDTVFVDISDTQREAFSDVMIGIVLGPDDSDKIKAVIGDLPLL